MSDYGNGAIELMEILDLDPAVVVGDLMNKLKADAELATRNISVLGEMNKAQFEEIARLKAAHEAHLELIDDVANHNTIRVLCKSCDNSYVMDYELSLFDPQQSYCGGSDRCCP